MIHNEGTLRKIFFTVLKFKKNNIYHEIERSGCFYFTFFSAYQFTHFCWVQNELFERLLNYFCENEYLKHVIDDKVYMKIKMLNFSNLELNTSLPASLQLAEKTETV